MEAYFCSRELSRRHPIAGITDTGGQLILPLSSGLLSQLAVLGCGPCTANPRCMPAWAPATDWVRRVCWPGRALSPCLRLSLAS